MKPYLREFEEYKTLSRFWGWVALFLLCAAVVGFGFLHMAVIHDVPRTWDFGVLPMIPAESKYSTHEPPLSSWNQQIHSLPEAYPFEKLKPDTTSAFSKECR